MMLSEIFGWKNYDYLNSMEPHYEGFWATINAPNNEPAICFMDRLDWRFMMIWPILYFFIYNYSVKLNVKSPFVLSTHLLSMIDSLVFLAFLNYKTLFAYYIFDLFICVYRRDPIMIMHHIGSMYVLSWCPDENAGKIITATLLLKLGDCSLHVHKIVSQSHFYSDYYDACNRFIYNALSFTITCWVLFRILMPCLLYPFYGYTLNIIAIALHLVNVFWLSKLFDLRARYRALIDKPKTY